MATCICGSSNSRFIASPDIFNRSETAITLLAQRDSHQLCLTFGVIRHRRGRDHVDHGSSGHVRTCTLRCRDDAHGCSEVWSTSPRRRLASSGVIFRASPRQLDIMHHDWHTDYGARVAQSVQPNARASYVITPSGYSVPYFRYNTGWVGSMALCANGGGYYHYSFRCSRVYGRPAGSGLISIRRS
jgi:hypothetical protein